MRFARSTKIKGERFTFPVKVKPEFDIVVWPFTVIATELEETVYLIRFFSFSRTSPPTAFGFPPFKYAYYHFYISIYI